MAASNAEFEMRVKALESRVSRLSEDMDAQTDILSLVHEDTQSLEAAVQGLKTNVQGLEAKAVAQETDTRAVAANVAELKADTHVLKRGIGALRDFNGITLDVEDGGQAGAPS